jgi:cell growth-regulating nucleolar protein
MSFVTKGPDSERGLSVNKALKRYHRERETRNGEEKEEDDKELFKSLRLRKNERGEIVIFAA